MCPLLLETLCSLTRLSLSSRVCVCVCVCVTHTCFGDTAAFTRSHTSVSSEGTLKSKDVENTHYDCIMRYSKRTNASQCNSHAWDVNTHDVCVCVRARAWPRAAPTEIGRRERSDRIPPRSSEILFSCSLFLNVPHWLLL